MGGSLWTKILFFLSCKNQKQETKPKAELQDSSFLPSEFLLKHLVGLGIKFDQYINYLTSYILYDDK